MSRQSFLFVITARGGSKGIPRKNMYPICGKPLYRYITEKLVAAKARNNWNNVDIVLSSDDADIINDANQIWPNIAPFTRPDYLASDTSESIDTVLHALNSQETKKKVYTYVGLVQPTSPLIDVEDIENLVNEILCNKGYFNSWTTVTEATSHPFKMKRLMQNGQIVNYIDQGFEDMRPRQTLPKVYKRSGAIYISKRDIAINTRSIINDPCFGLLIPNERAIDIDTHYDMDLVAAIMKERNNG